MFLYQAILFFFCLKNQRAPFVSQGCFVLKIGAWLAHGAKEELLLTLSFLCTFTIHPKI
jgi:hypothetical protein